MLYRLQRCELDAARFELRRGTQIVPVEPQVLELLLYLIAHRDRAVTRTELFEQLWRGRVVTDSALNSRIKAARSAIGDDGAAQSQIRTLHRTGYRFVGPVEERAAAPAEGFSPPAERFSPPAGSFPPPAEGVPQPADVPAAPARGLSSGASSAHPAATRSVARAAISAAARPFTRRRLRLAGAAVGLVLAATAFALLPRAWHDEYASGAAPLTAAPAAKPAPADARKALAVLPFANLSPEDEQAYFAEGVGEELLIVLSRMSDLQVTGRVSASYFKERNDPFPVIGETLGVDYLLTGSVRKAGERVRIAVALVDAANGYQVWSDSFERNVVDILDVQDEIAEHVATALQVKLGLGESGELGMTRNVAAYDEFLRGYASYVELRPETIPLAIEHMHRAIALDPSFARAWAYLYCIYRDGSQLVPERMEEWRSKGLEALAHAQALAPESPFVEILNAREHMRSGRLLEARAALDALPDGYWTADRYVTRDVFLARWSMGTGQARDAIEVLERARAADPLSPIVARYLAVAYANAGEAQKSLASSDRELELGGSLPTLTRNALLTALDTGDREEIERRVAALPHDDAGHRAISAMLVRHLRDPETARAELRRLESAAHPRDVVRSSLIAHWAAYYGDTELALEQLRTIAHGAVDEGVLWRPVLSEVRKQPGFKELVRSLGLVDYWQAYGWPDLCRPGAGGDFECA